MNRPFFVILSFCFLLQFRQEQCREVHRPWKQEEYKSCNESLHRVSGFEPKIEKSNRSESDAIPPHKQLILRSCADKDCASDKQTHPEIRNSKSQKDNQSQGHTNEQSQHNSHHINKIVMLFQRFFICLFHILSPLLALAVCIF